MSTFVRPGYLECVFIKTCQHLVCESSIAENELVGLLYLVQFTKKNVLIQGDVEVRQKMLKTVLTCTVINIARLFQGSVANATPSMSACQLQLGHLFGLTKASLGFRCGMVGEKYIENPTRFKRKWIPTCGFNILHWIAQSSSLCSHLTLSSLLFGNFSVEGSVTIGKIFHSSTAPWGFLQASIHVSASLLNEFLLKE